LVDLACTWAKALDLRVDLAFVAHPLDIETAEHSEHLFEDAFHAVESEGLVVDATVLSSTARAAAIADHAAARNAAMIAIATHARTGIARVGLGSVAMGVVSAAPCPVLISHARH
jgi:nucleotide-binding universal stress UspA family protein